MSSEQLKTKIIFDDEARKRLFEGLSLAAEAVGSTLGPKGKCVLIQTDQSKAPLVTKDGVTVSRSIRLSDPVQAMGANLVREAASRTNDVAGDGTTTATILTHSLVSEGLKLIAAGHDADDIRTGMELGVRLIIDELISNSVRVETFEDISHVGTISANGDRHIGELIAQTMERVGRDGVIMIEDAKGMSTTMDVVEGMQFDRGYLSPYFVNNTEKMQAVYSDPTYVLVTDKKLSTLTELIPMLESVHRSQGSLLIIAEDVEGEALQGLVLNRTKSNLKVVAVRAPGYGKFKHQLLSDIAVLTGGQLVSHQTGVSLEKFDPSILGQSRSVVVDAKTTTIVGKGDKKAIQERVEELRSQLQDITLDQAEIAHLRERIARLSSGVAVIKVGGATELEMIERKYRIEDALNATRAAAEEGIVLGGGMALFRAARNVVTRSDHDGSLVAGIGAALTACRAPLTRIVMNAGGNPELVFDRIINSDITNVGWNASEGCLCDMIVTGIIDPVKLTRTALENASSVAGIFLTLSAVVYEEDGRKT